MMTAVKRSYDNVDKSQEDKRLYRGLELDNGIKVRENNQSNHMNCVQAIMLLCAGSLDI